MPKQLKINRILKYPARFEVGSPSLGAESCLICHSYYNSNYEHSNKTNQETASTHTSFPLFCSHKPSITQLRFKRKKYFGHAQVPKGVGDGKMLNLSTLLPYCVFEAYIKGSEPLQNRKQCSKS